MISRYRISVGGVQMDSLDDNLLILDVQHSQPDRNIKKTTVANRDGYDVGDTYVGQRSVTVSFELHIYDIAERNRICQKVTAWAKKGGVLITNDRENQQLTDVICEQFPDIDSVRDWTKPLTVVFSTTTNPYWVSQTTSVRSMTGKSVSGTLNVDGNAGSALVSVEITAVSTITSLQIKVGSQTMKLTGLSVPDGNKVIIDYVRNRYLRIRANGSSVMPKLDPASSDLLLAECGKTTNISVTANNKVTSVFSARGCWM